MTLLHRLRAIVAALPAGSSVTLPRDWLAAELEVADEIAAPHTIVDFTIEDIAQLVGRKPSTIRMWCEMGLFSQAYKLRGRQWRIPRASFEEFQQNQRTEGPRRRPVPTPVRTTPDLSAWRKVWQKDTT